MKVMEEHLKEMAESLALEQARNELRLRTFDEYWLCLGPVKEKKKKKKGKGDGEDKNDEKSMRSATSSPSAENSEIRTDSPSFFDAFLKAPETVCQFSMTTSHILGPTFTSTCGTCFLLLNSYAILETPEPDIDHVEINSSQVCRY